MKTKLIAALILGSFVLAGCGGSGGPSQSSLDTERDARLAAEAAAAAAKMAFEEEAAAAAAAAQIAIGEAAAAATAAAEMAAAEGCCRCRGRWQPGGSCCGSCGGGDGG